MARAGNEGCVRQVLQDARTGEVAIEDVPTPALRAGGVLVHTAASVVSAGAPVNPACAISAALTPAIAPHPEPSFSMVG